MELDFVDAEHGLISLPSGALYATSDGGRTLRLVYRSPDAPVPVSSPTPAGPSEPAIVSSPPFTAPSGQVIVVVPSGGGFYMSFSPAPA
ncbi:MAG: hypothetical protein WB802_07320 [Candidatus Dormiibacterota bacterium]